jgi:catechol 2,3-dioxygenase-like lactoylglutathione lyase family enzyme
MATLLAAEPQLFSVDLGRSRAFYAGRLGFTVAFSYGEPPFYMQVVRDGARLNIRHAEHPVFDAGFKDREPDPLSATLVVDDATALFAEFRQSGVDFQQTLREEPWGARTFIVRDPDGNLICCAGRA